MQTDWFPLWLSLKVAGIAMLFSVPIGLYLAYILANRKFPGRSAVSAAIVAPFVLPPTVLGYYLLVLIGSESPLERLYEGITGGPLVFTWQAATLAAMIHTTPLLVILGRAAMVSVDRRYERAARSLGASDWRVFWRITLPLAQRPLAAAITLAFARAMGDFGITLMIAGNIPGRTQTAAVAIYDAVQSGNGALAMMLAVVVTVFAACLLALVNWIVPRAASA